MDDFVRVGGPLQSAPCWLPDPALHFGQSFQGDDDDLKEKDIRRRLLPTKVSFPNPNHARSFDRLAMSRALAAHTSFPIWRAGKSV